MSRRRAVEPHNICLYCCVVWCYSDRPARCSEEGEQWSHTISVYTAVLCGVTVIDQLDVQKKESSGAVQYLFILLCYVVLQ